MIEIEIEILASCEWLNFDFSLVLVLSQNPFCVKSIVSDVIRELLDGFFRPTFDSFKEFTLMTIVEVFNWLFELDLCSAQGVNLHEFL